MYIPLGQLPSARKDALAKRQHDCCLRGHRIITDYSIASSEASKGDISSIGWSTLTLEGVVLLLPNIVVRPASF